MSFYKDLIIASTGCTSEEVVEIEDIMRHDVVHSTLDWLSKSQFKKAAKEAYEVYQFMQSDEGKLYIKQLEESILNS